MRETLARIEDMKARWMTGGSAEAAAPPAWGAQSDLTLLALAGQFGRVAERPVPPPGTEPRPDLPRLALPPLPDPLRPLFRRALEDKDLGQERTLMLLHLLANRGVTCHPFDLIPKAHDALPAVYGPWLDWQADAPARDIDVLTAENWDDWTPHARRRELDRMASEAREDARALIAALAPEVAADQRLRLFEALEPGLEAEDAELLEAFATDRSGKVAELCQRLLTRLGRREATEEQIAELLGFVAVEHKGVFRKEPRIALAKLKTSAQRERRAEVLASVSVERLAQALGLSTGDLVALWPASDIGEFTAAVAETGPVDMVRALALRLIAPDTAGHIALLLPRLSTADRREIGTKIASIENLAFSNAAQCLASCPGHVPHAIIGPAPGMVELEKAMRAEGNKNDPLIHKALLNLGLIADADAADKLMTTLTTKLGLLAADPRLALLRLNASLKETAP